MKNQNYIYIYIYAFSLAHITRTMSIFTLYVKKYTRIEVFILQQENIT